MLLKLTGSSGGGKTTLSFAVAGRLPGTAVQHLSSTRSASRTRRSRRTGATR